MTDQQKNALIYAAAYLSLADHNGLTILAHKKDGSTYTVEPEVAVTAICVAFGLDDVSGPLGFRDAVRAALGEKQ